MMIGHSVLPCKRSFGHPDFFLVYVRRQNESLPHLRALAPLFGHGAGAFGIGKNSIVLTKILKNNVLCMKFLFICQTDIQLTWYCYILRGTSQ